MHANPSLKVIAPGASPQEAAAVVAALEQFMRDTAPPPAALPAPAQSAWKRAGLLEGVGLSPDDRTPWA